MQPLLFFDTFPVDRWTLLKTQAKIWIKEGIICGGIFDRIFYTGAFGSVRIPNALHLSLTELGMPVLRNDFSIPPKCDTALVIRDVRCLRWALEQKKAGHLRRIIAGPFICTMPFEANEILLDPAIDMLLFLSKWHREMFIREASRNIPASSIWWAGINTEEWKPTGEKRNQILIFKKQVDPNVFQCVIGHVKESGLPFKILEYGNYTTKEYREELSKSLFSIMLHKTETQGLATFEAWSCDTPTLHCDPGKMNFLGKTYVESSSCPYLDEKAGIRFKDETEFKEAFQQMRDRLSTFRPREYIVENFTLDHSADLFLNILAETRKGRSTPEEPIDQNVRLAEPLPMEC